DALETARDTAGPSPSTDALETRLGTVGASWPSAAARETARDTAGPSSPSRDALETATATTGLSSPSRDALETATATTATPALELVGITAQGASQLSTLKGVSLAVRP